jgi:hypothetical protein
MRARSNTTRSAKAPRRTIRARNAGRRRFVSSRPCPSPAPQNSPTGAAPPSRADGWPTRITRSPRIRDHRPGRDAGSARTAIDFADRQVTSEVSGASRTGGFPLLRPGALPALPGCRLQLATRCGGHPSSILRTRGCEASSGPEPSGIIRSTRTRAIPRATRGCDARSPWRSMAINKEASATPSAQGPRDAQAGRRLPAHHPRPGALRLGPR